MTPDKSKVDLSSADVRITNQRGRGPDPFWPELALNFPATPSEVYDWASLIFSASDFNQLFDEE